MFREHIGENQDRKQDVFLETSSYGFCFWLVDGWGGGVHWSGVRGGGLLPSHMFQDSQGRRKAGRRVQQVCRSTSLFSTACDFEQFVNKFTLLFE